MKMPPLAWRPWPAHWPPSPTMRKRVCPAFGTSARRTTPAADQRPLIPCPSIRPEYCDEPANESTALPGPAAHRWPVVQFQLRVDIDVTAKIQRATRNAMLDQGAGALCQRHVDGPEHAPLIGNLVAQAWPRGVGMPSHAPQRFVEMDMAFHQSGQ